MPLPPKRPSPFRTKGTLPYHPNSMVNVDGTERISLVPGVPLRFQTVVHEAITLAPHEIMPMKEKCELEKIECDKTITIGREKMKEYDAAQVFAANEISRLETQRAVKHAEKQRLLSGLQAKRQRLKMVQAAKKANKGIPDKLKTLDFLLNPETIPKEHKGLSRLPLLNVKGDLICESDTPSDPRSPWNDPKFKTKTTSDIREIIDRFDRLNFESHLHFDRLCGKRWFCAKYGTSIGRVIANAEFTKEDLIHYLKLLVGDAEDPLLQAELPAAHAAPSSTHYSNQAVAPPLSPHQPIIEALEPDEGKMVISCTDLNNADDVYKIASKLDPEEKQKLLNRLKNDIDATIIASASMEVTTVEMSPASSVTEQQEDSSSAPRNFGETPSHGTNTPGQRASPTNQESSYV
ncbi:unnamed protein product [Cylindrotheca closterium]|uniref:Uncharacterized protein n=1 Tax=Cylindrotheca closterium TaxID=2856 RepID=A0AAD2FV78_9STRA|nr:unnamed protein product [Cylindrotheca closterium]